MRIALAGDVMIGRGVDQVMSQPVDPALYEGWAKSALDYVGLAESVSGSIPRRVDPSYVWGDSLHRLESQSVDFRIINLETALTARGAPWPGKGIHYRAHPDNANCLSVGGIDVAVLANNHILDWSDDGLIDTVETLDELAVARTGAGRDEREAWQPALATRDSGQVIVLGVGTPSSGIPREWRARGSHPGVALVPESVGSWVDRYAGILAGRRSRDVVVASIHWGSNWGYEIPHWQTVVARSLIEKAGVDVVHGHSSHHPKGVEFYRDGIILYGSGDLLNDYEGISGHQEFRPALSGWWVVDVDGLNGGVRGLSMIPTKVRRFQLTTPDETEIAWLARTIEAQSRGVSIEIEREVLELHREPDVSPSRDRL